MGVLGCVICVAGYPLSVSGTHTRPLKGGDQLLLAASQLCGFAESDVIPTQGGIQIDWITEGKT